VTPKPGHPITKGLPQMRVFDETYKKVAPRGCAGAVDGGSSDERRGDRVGEPVGTRAGATSCRGTDSGATCGVVGRGEIAGLHVVELVVTPKPGHSITKGLPQMRVFG